MWLTLVWGAYCVVLWSAFGSAVMHAIPVNMLVDYLELMHSVSV